MRLEKEMLLNGQTKKTLLKMVTVMHSMLNF